MQNYKLYFNFLNYVWPSSYSIFKKIIIYFIMIHFIAKKLNHDL
jgi:hypothetical protein